MGILDQRRHRASDSDSVAAHDHRMRLSILVQILALHRCGIFGSELEDVSDFNSAFHLQRLARHRTGIAFPDGRDIRHQRILEVAPVIEVDVVESRLVGADHQIGRSLHRAVHHNHRLCRINSHRRRIARTAPAFRICSSFANDSSLIRSRF